MRDTVCIGEARYCGELDGGEEGDGRFRGRFSCFDGARDEEACGGDVEEFHHWIDVLDVDFPEIGEIGLVV